jgi:hypothetical protein
VAGAALRHVRGEVDRKVGIPQGQPERSREGSHPRPPRSVALAAKLRSHSMVTRLDNATLRALLPFPTPP